MSSQYFQTHTNHVEQIVFITSKWIIFFNIENRIRWRFIFGSASINRLCDRDINVDRLNEIPRRNEHNCSSWLPHNIPWVIVLQLQQQQAKATLIHMYIDQSKFVANEPRLYLVKLIYDWKRETDSVSIEIFRIFTDFSEHYTGIRVTAMRKKHSRNCKVQQAILIIFSQSKIFLATTRNLSLQMLIILLSQRNRLRYMFVCIFPPQNHSSLLSLSLNMLGSPAHFMLPHTENIFLCVCVNFLADEHSTATSRFP